MGTTSTTPAVTPGAYVLVRTPGGYPLEEATVRCSKLSWEGQTDRRGVARIPIPKDDYGKLKTAADGTNLELTVDVQAPHCGPVVASNAPWAVGTLTLTTLFSPTTAKYPEGAPNVEALSIVVPGADGKPVTGTRGFLVAVLVEGGALGKLYSSTHLRRLVASQVLEELIYHVSHGQLVIKETAVFQDGVARDANRAIRFNYADASGDPKGKIEIATTKINAIRVISGRPHIAGISFYNFELANGLKSVKVLSDMLSISALHLRFVLGLVRLCGLLSSKCGIKTILTQGFITKNNDAHGAGRAFDLGGLSTEVLKSGQTRTLEPLKDYLVAIHWGQVNLLVNEGGAMVRKDSNMYDVDPYSIKNYSLNPSDSQPHICYRLESLPGETPPISSAAAEAAATEAENRATGAADAARAADHTATDADAAAATAAAAAAAPHATAADQQAAANAAAAATQAHTAATEAHAAANAAAAEATQARAAAVAAAAAGPAPVPPTAPGRKRTAQTKYVTEAHLDAAEKLFKAIHGFCSVEFSDAGSDIAVAPPVRDVPSKETDANFADRVTKHAALMKRMETDDVVRPIGSVQGNLFYPDYPFAGGNNWTGDLHNRIPNPPKSKPGEPPPPPKPPRTGPLMQSDFASNGRMWHMDHFHIQIGHHKKDTEVE